MVGSYSPSEASFGEYYPERFKIPDKFFLKFLAIILHFKKNEKRKNIIKS